MIQCHGASENGRRPRGVLTYEEQDSASLCATMVYLMQHRAEVKTTLEQTASGFAITAVHLNVAGKVPGASQQVFETAVVTAKNGCPVSKVLKADITMDATLES